MGRVVLLISSICRHFGKYITIMKELHKQGELSKICALEKINNKKRKGDDDKDKKAPPLKGSDVEAQLEQIMSGDLEAGGGASGKADQSSQPTLVRVQNGVGSVVAPENGRHGRTEQAGSAALTEFKGAAPEATV
jgi:hypothetical protein